MKHRIDVKSIRDFCNGILTNNLEFYDEFPKVPEVGGSFILQILIMGATNSGKSSLLSRMCTKRKMQRSGRRLGITHSLYFYAIGANKGTEQARP